MFRKYMDKQEIKYKERGWESSETISQKDLGGSMRQVDVSSRRDGFAEKACALLGHHIHGLQLISLSFSYLYPGWFGLKTVCFKKNFKKWLDSNMSGIT